MIQAGSTNYSNSALGVAQESGGSSISYIRDPNGLLVVENGPSGTIYPIFDANGSVVGFTNSSGQLIDTYGYDPYGQVTSHTGTTQQPCQYECAYGAYTDRSTGLVRMGGILFQPATATPTQSGGAAGAAPSAAPNNLWGGFDVGGCGPSCEANWEHLIAGVLGSYGLNKPPRGAYEVERILDEDGFLRGFKLRERGSTGDKNILRFMRPDNRYSNGYMRYWRGNVKRAIDPATGKVAKGRLAVERSHIQPGHGGPLRGLPDWFRLWQ
jgi:YD repeat-containing protein